MELASMLAGEPFSDAPDCACPVVSAYMRTWNDGLPYAERQKLKAYAPRAVGTRASRELTRRRVECCLQHSGARLAGRTRVGRRLERLRWRLRIAAGIGIAPALRVRDGAAIYAARLALAQGGNPRAAEVLDDLIALGGRPEPPSFAPPVEPPSPPRARDFEPKRDRVFA
jgi:hypothetical protein